MQHQSLELRTSLGDLAEWIVNLWQIWIIIAGFVLVSSLALYYSERQSRTGSPRLSLMSALYLTVVMCLAYSGGNYEPASLLGRLVTLLNHVMGLFLVGIVVFIVTQALL